MTEPDPDQLSPAGQARCASMLGELVSTMERTHRGRRQRRRALAVTASVAVVALAVRVVVWPGSDGTVTPRFVEAPPVPSLSVEDEPHVLERYLVTPRPLVTRMVPTDPDVLGRYRADPRKGYVRLDDDALLEVLASIRRPAGLIRIGDTVRLTAAVTDAELGFERQ